MDQDVALATLRTHESSFRYVTTDGNELLLQWQTPPLKGQLTHLGLTGTARVLSSTSSSDVARSYRIHVCAAQPCVQLMWSFAKWYPLEPPRWHGRASELIPAGGAVSAVAAAPPSALSADAEGKPSTGASGSGPTSTEDSALVPPSPSLPPTLLPPPLLPPPPLDSIDASGSDPPPPSPGTPPLSAEMWEAGGRGITDAAGITDATVPLSPPLHPLPLPPPLLPPPPCEPHVEQPPPSLAPPLPACQIDSVATAAPAVAGPTVTLSAVAPARELSLQQLLAANFPRQAAHLPQLTPADLSGLPVLFPSYASSPQHQPSLASASAGPAVAGRTSPWRPALVEDVVKEEAVAAQEIAPTQVGVLLDYARELRIAGRYVGFLAFLCFGLHYEVRVNMWIGRGTQEVVGLFAPWAFDGRRFADAVDVVALRTVVDERTGETSYRHCGDDVQSANHFVAAFRLEAPLEIPGDSVEATYGREGLLLFPTVLDGDCAVDTMLAVLGLPSTKPARLQMRLRLAQQLVELADDSRFQESCVSTLDVPCVPIADGATTLPPEVDSAKTPSTATRVWHELGATSTEGGAEVGARGGGPTASPTPSQKDAVAWAANLDQRSEAIRDDLCSRLSPDDLRAVEARYNGAPRATQTEPVGARPRASSRRSQPLPRKAALVLQFHRFCEERGLDAGSSWPYGLLTEFLKGQGHIAVDQKEMNRLRSNLVRAIRLHRARHLLPLGSYSAAGRVPAGSRTVPYHRRRRRPGAGRPPSFPVLREMLFDWFCSIRRSVLSRVPLMVLRLKARELWQEHIVACLREGVPCPTPQLTDNWFRRWRLEYGVSLRKPNRKYKVSRWVLHERLRIGWCNIFAVRALCLKANGYDMEMENFDQAPFHMNEAGSRGDGTLALRGASRLILKECHAATRSRWSVNTMTTSCPERAKSGPPVEVMFKADGERLARALSLEVPLWAPWLTVVTSPKASYREEHVLAFLEEHLPPLTEGRPWRILLCDAFAPQMSEAVRHLAWQRGYVLLVHGGGCTGVAQPNDTDLHLFLRRGYLTLEEADMLTQQRLNPSRCPYVRPKDALLWMATVWSNKHLHTHASKGFWRCGLRNCLDGTEDNFICREARDAWDELGMSELRERTVHDVDVEYTNGRLRWTYDDVQKLISPYPRRGQLDFVQDDEGDVTDDDEPPPQTADAEGNNDEEAEDLAESDDGDLEDIADGTAEEAAAPAVADLTPEQAGIVEEHRRRIAWLEQLLKDTEHLDDPHLELTLRRALHTSLRRARGSAQTHPAVALTVVSQEVAQRSAESRQRRLVEDASRGARALKRDREQLKADTERLKKARADLRAAQDVASCDDALRTFSLEDLGAGHGRGGTAAHCRCRVDVLDRVQRHGRAFTPMESNNWEWFRRAWDTQQARTHGQAWAELFRERVLDVLRKVASGNVDAVADFMLEETRRCLAATPVLRC